MVKRSRESSVISTGSDGDSAVTPESRSESPRPAKLNTAMADGSRTGSVMQCSLPPHREVLDFTSIEDFEVHYAQHHSNRCTSCGKNFPTAHFLALHLDENHNALREELQKRGEKTYGCFVEDCEKKCSTPQKRRLHLIDKHLFPKVYNFRIVDIGIDKSISMLQEGRRRRISTTADQNISTGHRRRQSRAESLSNVVDTSTQSRNAPIGKEDFENAQSERHVSETAIKDLETSMSTLRFVPPQVKQRNKQGPA